MVIIAQDTKLRPGYKQTEVGVIPEDWDVKKLRDLCDEISDGTHQTPKYVNDGIPFYSVENVTANNFSNTKYISEQEHKNLIKRCNPEKGNILLTRIGSLGDTKLIDWNVNASIYVSLALLKLKKNLDPNYLYCYSKSKRFVIDIEKRSLLNATPKKINKGDISNIPIPIPHSTTEQSAIATILCDTDLLIASLDKLIAKKRDIKQATMQQLLTGKTRLPGFNREWKVWKFGEIFQFLNTANNSRSDLSVNGDIKYIHYGDIHTKWRSFLDCSSNELPLIQRDKVRNVPFLEDGDLVMADASEDFDGIGISIEVKNATGRKIVAGQHTFLLRGNKEVLANGFKGYLQYIPAVKDALKKAATGISVYGISKNNVRNISICLPSTTEQTAIATVLSDMDAEITALEQKRDKTRALKQGMMQELLTGKTRLL